MAALIPVLAAAAVYGMSSRDREVTMQRASVDGRQYLVLRRPDSSAAANLLATVRADLEALVAHVVRANPRDEGYARLARRFDGDAISEGRPNHGYTTSFTVDKARVVLCVRQTGGEFVPRPVIMYVAIHELAHILTKSTGHTDEFWNNNARLIAAAKAIGIYEDQNFDRAPAPYCGITIGPGA